MLRGVSALVWMALATLPILAQPEALPGSVRIGVFSLFHPTELRVGSAEDTALQVTAGGRRHTLPVGATMVVRRTAAGWALRFPDGSTLTGREVIGVTRQAGILSAEPGRFWLEVPGKLRRDFFGRLSIAVRGHVLEAVGMMPLEVAVASVVEAESPPGARLEALKAQAVAARSFLVARQAGHTHFDFCDTTHCQFLRAPPSAGSRAAQATRATAGLVLRWHDAETAEDHTLAALYARSCGGRTRTLRAIGVESKGYPYYAVRCAYCMRHPERWQRAAGTPTGAAVTEHERLAYNRVHGWGAVPSLGGGQGIGHGVGLCQLGAAAMARQGAGFAAILAHYYPNTRIESEP